MQSLSVYAYSEELLLISSLHTVQTAKLLSWLTYDIVGLIGLIILGLIILLVIRLIIVLVPAAIVAIVVYFLTNSTWWAGLAFLIVAALSILKKL